MPCYTEPPEQSWTERLETLLCQCCQNLPVEIINKLGRDNSGYIPLINWYISHLIHDFSTNYENDEEVKKYQKEANRFGLRLVKLKNGGYTAANETTYKKYLDDGEIIEGIQMDKDFEDHKKWSNSTTLQIEKAEKTGYIKALEDIRKTINKWLEKPALNEWRNYYIKGFNEEINKLIEEKK